jgi:energy-coupling factor transporter transmembrane protein EcfT
MVLIALALILSLVAIKLTLSIAGIVLTISYIIDSNRLKKTIWRVRFLILTMAAILIFSTPGQYVLTGVDYIRPSYEGLYLAIEHICKLVCMLSALSIVFSTTNNSQFVGGIYQLLSPLDKVGINAKTFAVRIWLTLNYFESNKKLIVKNNVLTLLSELETVQSQQIQSEAIMLNTQTFTWIHMFQCLMLFTLCVFVWLF